MKKPSEPAALTKQHLPLVRSKHSNAILVFLAWQLVIKDYLSLMASGEGTNLLSLIKKIYFRLASPLHCRILSEVDTRFAGAMAEISNLSDSLKSLQADCETLKRHVDQQKDYIQLLQAANLHGILAQYSSSEMRSPMAVIDALGDVLAGMEPSTASLKHKIPADELVTWARSLQSRCPSGPVDGSKRAQDIQHDNASTIVDLCERQLEFNARMYRDREAAATQELARLSAELALEKHANHRAVSAK